MFSAAKSLRACAGAEAGGGGGGGGGTCAAPVGVVCAIGGADPARFTPVVPVVSLRGWSFGSSAPHSEALITEARHTRGGSFLSHVFFVGRR